MALRLVSLILLLPVTLVNVYWASGLEDNARYIASQNDGLCGGIGGLAVLGIFLPWLFLVLGIAAAVQLIIWGRFTLSAAVLLLHQLHNVLLLSLLVIGNSYCNGTALGFAIRVLSGPIFLALLVAALPLPILVLQVKHWRKSLP